MIKHDFPSTDVEAWIAEFDVAITRTDRVGRHDHTGLGWALAGAMDAVLAVALLARADPTPPWVTIRLPGFRAHVREQLQRRRTAVAVWLATLEMALWQRNRSGWWDAAMARSAAEVVRQDIDDPADPVVPPGRLAEIDAEMREIGPTLNALPPTAIPSGLPDEHRWWHLPAGPDEPDEPDPAAPTGSC